MTTSHTGADRRELPDGTVTFLFSDIEGSTRLLHELGEAAYADALARHRRILRDAFVRYGGVDATEASRHRSGVALESWLAKMNDETMTRLRSGLRDDAFEQAWQRGTLLAVEEVVERCPRRTTVGRLVRSWPERAVLTLPAEEGRHGH